MSRLTFRKGFLKLFFIINNFLGVDLLADIIPLVCEKF